MLLFPVFEEPSRKPHEDGGGVLKVVRRRWHQLAAGRTLCGAGTQVIVVADREFGYHSGSLESVAKGSLNLGSRRIDQLGSVPALSTSRSSDGPVRHV